MVLVAHVRGLSLERLSLNDENLSVTGRHVANPRQSVRARENDGVPRAVCSVNLKDRPRSDRFDHETVRVGI